MKRLVTALAVLIAAITLSVRPAQAVDDQVVQAQQGRIAVVKKVAPTVVAIFSSDGGGGGSGVLISPDGYALSNFHVTDACGEFMKCGLNDGVLYDAVIVGIDPTGDVALIKMLGRDDFPYAAMGDSDALSVGDWTYAMGNPFLLATDFQPTVTFGMVSGLHRYQYPAGTLLEYTDCIQVDTSINPGNSGGPLFNSKGEVVGINGRIAVEKRGRVNVGAGYAISINQIKHFMDQLRGGHIVDHATLGATVRTGTDRAVMVDSILETSDAYRRGLREDDEIIAFAGRPIGSVNQFKNILGIYPKGWTLPLVYRREGKKFEIYVELPALHRKSELAMQDEKQKQPHGPKRGPQPPRDAELNEKPAQEDELPAEYKKLHVKKTGYANYYFNQLEQKRALAGLAPFASWKGVAGRWNMTGVTNDGDQFEIKLLPQALSAKFSKRAPGLQRLDDSDFEDEPPGTGGLLAALLQFKQFLTEGESAFTEFTYYGSQPLDGQQAMFDVIVTRRSSIECRWYFRQADGAFVGFDSSLGPGIDSCEIRFHKIGEFQGRQFPNRISIRYGDIDYGLFEIKSLDVTPINDGVK